MLKMTIDNEEVVSDKDITINEEMLSASSTILNNVYPKEWEEDKDYTSRFYYPQDYSKALIQRSYVTQEAEAGTTIQVNGSVTLNDVDTTKNSRVLRLLGQTSQAGTPTPSSPIPVNVVSGDNEINICGKNLLNINNWVKGRINNTTGNIEYANNVSSMVIGENNISFVVSQAWNSGITSDFIPTSTGNYVFKYGHNREITMAIDTYDSQKTKIARIDAFTQTQTPTTRTFTISDSNVKYIRIHFEVNTANVEYIVSEMQLEKGSTATTYEPYIGSSYPLYLGVENLFKGYNDMISGFLPSSGSYPTTNSSFPDAKYMLIYLKAGQSITTDGSTSSNGRIRYIDKDTNLVVGGIGANETSYYKSSGDYQGSFASGTITAKKDFIIGILVLANSPTYSDFKITYGTHLQKISDTPIELCKIGTYQDYIYKDSDKWYLHKEIGKIVLNGSESWTKSSNTNVNRYYIPGTFIKTILNANTIDLISDYFTCITPTQSDAYNIGLSKLNDTSIMVNFSLSDTSFDTLQKFTNWLSTHNTEVYYILATPTNTEITYEPLIEQLNALSSQ